MKDIIDCLSSRCLLFRDFATGHLSNTNNLRNIKLAKLIIFRFVKK